MINRRTGRFLWCGDALQVHVLCLGLFVALSIDFWNGQAVRADLVGLLFTVVAYPVLLTLIWWSRRLDPLKSRDVRSEEVVFPDRLRRAQHP